MEQLMEQLRSFYKNGIVNFISSYFPLLIVVNHFTDSTLLCFVALLIYGAIAALTPFDILFNLLFGVAGCILIFIDGYPLWIVALYLILVVPKFVLFFLMATRFK